MPFSFAPVPITLVCFAAGGLIYGPFVPLTYALFQSATPAADLPAVLAARGTVVIVSTPLGIALGGPLVSLPGGGGTLVASGLATVLLAAVSLLVWPRQPASDCHESLVPEQVGSMNSKSVRERGPYFEPGA